MVKHNFQGFTKMTHGPYFFLLLLLLLVLKSIDTHQRAVHFFGGVLKKGIIKNTKTMRMKRWISFY